MPNIVERIHELNQLNLNKKENKVSKQSDFLSSVTARNFIVGTVTNAGTVSVGTTPVVHQFESQASSEARRLAGLNPGTAYVVFQMRGAFVANGVTAY